MLRRRRERRVGDAAPGIVLAEAGKTRVHDPYTDGLVQLATFTGAGEWFNANFTATMQIVDGYAKCRDDILTANIVVVDAETNTIVVAGKADKTSRHDSKCGDPFHVYNNNKTDLKPLYPPSIFYAEEGKTYVWGISYAASTDDTCEFTWSTVVMVSYGPELGFVPKTTLDLGNRLLDKVDQFRNYYAKVVWFQATGSYVIVPATTGQFGIGEGGGHDELRGQVVIKEGKQITGDPAIASKPTIYQGPVSDLATRNTDASLSFTSNFNERIFTKPGGVYTMMVKFDVDTDDRVEVYWPTFTIAFAKLGF
jgi:hypothetical protein